MQLGQGQPARVQDQQLTETPESGRQAVSDQIQDRPLGLMASQGPVQQQGLITEEPSRLCVHVLTTITEKAITIPDRDQITDLQDIQGHPHRGLHPIQDHLPPDRPQSPVPAAVQGHPEADQVDPDVVDVCNLSILQS